MRTRAWAAALMVTAVAACGATTPEAQQLIDASAQWECDRQRFAFDSLADIEAARTEALSDAAITEEAYAAFELSLDSDPGLRSAVFAAYEQYCGVPDGDGVATDS